MQILPWAIMQIDGIAASLAQAVEAQMMFFVMVMSPSTKMAIRLLMPTAPMLRLPGSREQRPLARLFRAPLPPAVSALKSQQFRWTKGGTETAKKHLSTLLSSNLPFPVKGHGVFHLIYSFGFISILACIILTVPIIFIKEYYPQYNIFFKLTSLLKISFLIYIIHYFISYFNNTAGNFFKKFFSFIIYFPLFVSLFIGLSLSNAYGILQGYFGIKSSFIRTPKFNSINGQHTKKFNKYLQTKLNWVIVTEGLLIFYFLFGLSLSLYLKKYGNVPLLLMAFIGFSMVFWWSLFEVKYKYISQQTA